jgi:hypothetical protein
MQFSVKKQKFLSVYNFYMRKNVCIYNKTKEK